MNGFERVERVFARQNVDHAPIGEDFWGETIEKWQKEGHLKAGEDAVEHFNLDLHRSGLIKWTADIDFKPQIIEENLETMLLLDGNGAINRTFKHKAGGVEHVGYRIKEQRDWEELIKPHLVQVDRRRIPFERYREKRKAAAERGMHFSSDAFGPFEMIHRMCGHETLLMNIALEPEWVKDMVMTYTDFNIMHFEVLFQEEGLPSGTWVADDLGFKEKPFISPAMFEDVFMPGYQKMNDYLHSKGLKVMLHSCGYVEPLVSGIIESGFDCLEGLEAKAGMDIGRIFQQHGDQLVFFGNMDILSLERNDRQIIDEQMEKLSHLIKNGVRYMLHSDHSISPKIEYDTYCYVLDRARSVLHA